jgi:hypothetical protein
MSEAGHRRPSARWGAARGSSCLSRGSTLGHHHHHAPQQDASVPKDLRIQERSCLNDVETERQPPARGSSTTGRQKRHTSAGRPAPIIHWEAADHSSYSLFCLSRQHDRLCDHGLLWQRKGYVSLLTRAMYTYTRHSAFLDKSPTLEYWTSGPLPQSTTGTTPPSSPAYKTFAGEGGKLYGAYDTDYYSSGGRGLGDFEVPARITKERVSATRKNYTPLYVIFQQGQNRCPPTAAFHACPR